jgi:thiol-disulfide isomerase/thioredoxin
MISMQLAALALAFSGADETVLLDFHAPWCAPCRTIDSTVAQLDDAGYPVRKINIDNDRSLANQYGVQNIPCFVLVVDGKEAGRLTGAVRRAELLELFAKAGVGPNNTRVPIARGQSPDPPLASVPMNAEAAGNPFTPARGAPAHLDAGANADLPRASATAQELIEASVRLTIHDAQGASYGSGTIIDARQGEALVLTCGHIFRDSQGKGGITVDLFGPQAPQKVPGRLVVYDLKDGNDIGLVSIRLNEAVRVAPVAPRGYRIAKGDPVITVGCNNGGPATAVMTNITAIGKFLGPPNVQVAGLPVQGRSGGGLFTADGQVIGVCIAADPTDREGLYAALAAIHDHLDQAGLSAVYENRPAQPAPARLAAAEPKSPPVSGPVPTAGRFVPGDFRAQQTAADRGAAIANAALATAALGSAQPSGAVAAAPVDTGTLDANERATLAELRKRGDNAEVICIVRSLSDPQAKSQVIMLDHASPSFLQQLAADRQAQDARHLTSLNVRRPTSANVSSTSAPVQR